MTNDIYKIVYCSRNQIAGTPEEIKAGIQSILNTSRINNAKANVTGALLFNEGLFAQVLEGPVAAVETIFEKIQRDTRHSDVIVLQSGTFAERDFPAWSMAFAARGANSATTFGIPAFEAAKSNLSLAADQVLALLHKVVVQEDWMMP
ncbi:MAG: BLUF domain-containing protein [Bryobacteraceae bacterium]